MKLKDEEYRFFLIGELAKKWNEVINLMKLLEIPYTLTNRVEGLSMTSTLHLDPQRENSTESDDDIFWAQTPCPLLEPNGELK